MADAIGPLQLMYGIDGRSDLTEETLDHLEGYRGSRPVRIGNAAHRQLQLDIYGELMDAVYLYNKYVEPIGYDGWVRTAAAGRLAVRQLETRGRRHLGGARRSAALRLLEASCRGWPWIAACGWPTSDRSRRIGHAG